MSTAILRPQQSASIFSDNMLNDGLLTDDIFTMITERQLVSDTESHIPHNYCISCKIPMDIDSSEYKCTSCGYMTKSDTHDGRDYNPLSKGSLRVRTGRLKGKRYNCSQDYAETQKKMILSYILKLNSRYKGAAFPLDVLTRSAAQYNTIQKIVEVTVDETGKVTGEKKFVRRANTKDEIIAAIIHFECIRAGIVRKKNDIALFMALSKGGFARGEEVLRGLQARGEVDIPIGREPPEGFIDRYLEALGIENPLYTGFILDVIKVSEDNSIGMSSQLSSKIVGAIWIIIEKCKLNITAQVLEAAADNTKKNTFIKFYKVVFDDIDLFRDIFIKYGIPVK